MSTFYCRIRSYKVKDLEKIDTRVVGTNQPDWRRIASEFRHNLKDNVEKELISIVHDYPTFGGYKLIDVPILPETNLLLFSNDCSQHKGYASYQIDFFNRNGHKISSITIETLHERNMFNISPPTGAISLSYSIDNESWKEHHYDLGFECLQCVPLSDSD
jgi:hypothetical protein